MFDAAGAPMKTLVAKELQRHDGRWQITRSMMSDHTSGRTTEILIEHVETKEIPFEAFTVASLEKP
jgi:Outer membrane lipoprotein-sorting protein